ncbi:MAG: hypothetical protein WCJ64_19745 [Rhodospirillaceae bacterium]
MSARRPSITETMNLFGSSLRGLPGVTSVHAGFDGDVPVVIVTVRNHTTELEKMIAHTVRGAEFRIIPVSSQGSVSARDALHRYGSAVMKIESVTSVGLAKSSGTISMMVRCLPLSGTVKEKVYAAAPDAPLQFRESRHNKYSGGSISEFILKKIKAPVLLLLAAAIIFFTLLPIFKEIKDINVQVGAETTEGTVITAGRPYESSNTKGFIVQPVAVKFNDRGRDLVFTEQVPIMSSIYHKIKKDVVIYRDGDRISISYYSKDPLGSAKVYDVRPPPDPTMFFASTLFIVGLILLLIWKRWQEW